MLRVRRIALRAASWLVAAVALLGCQSGPSASEVAKAREAEAAAAAAAAAAAPPPTLEPGQSLSLFDGTALGLWRIEDLGQQQNVQVADGVIQLGWGNPGTAIEWTGPEAAVDYELRFELQRGKGSGDAYCFVTFPVGDQSCTLVLGDWVGVQCRSSGEDAAERGGFKRTALEPERWHAVRLRVVASRIQVSLDGEVAIEVPLVPPASASADAPRALSIATWSMVASLRELHLERLEDASR